MKNKLFIIHSKEGLPKGHNEYDKGTDLLCNGYNVTILISRKISSQHIKDEIKFMLNDQEY